MKYGNQRSYPELHGAWSSRPPCRVSDVNALVSIRRATDRDCQGVGTKAEYPVTLFE